MEMIDQRTALFSTLNNSRNRYSRCDEEKYKSSTISSKKNTAIDTQAILEEQNDQYMIDLEAKVSDLKSVSIAMRQHVKESSDILSSLTDEMGSIGILLKGTIFKIKSLGGTNSWKHIWIIILFIFFIFLLMYILFKRN